MPAVSSHYEIDLAAKTSRLLKRLTSGTVVFTEPPGPAACSGASQKPMYLACDYGRATGVLDDIRVVLIVPTPTIFAEVNGAARSIVIRADDGTESRIGLSSPEADGFAAIDAIALRHPRYPEVWALGDAAATRNSKSGGALRKQTKVLAQNLRSVLRGEEPTAEYTGYSVAPFTVSRNTVVFAEFDDRYRRKPTIPFWMGLARERRLTWVFDRHILPWVYWHLILKGRA